jgi:glutathione S-transferase
MKLYFSSGSCSLASHIVARELGSQLDVIKNERGKPLPDGRLLAQINSKAQVPTLELDDGSVLTEGAVIVQYLADQAGENSLVPRAGMPRYRVLEWLNYVAAEIHKSYSPLFGNATPDEYKTISRTNLGKKYEWVVSQLGEKKFLTGDEFTAADAYLFTVTRWGVGMKLDLPPAILAYQERVAARPAVQQALGEQGLGGK